MWLQSKLSSEAGAKTAEAEAEEAPPGEDMPLKLEAKMEAGDGSHVLVGALPERSKCASRGSNAAGLTRRASLQARIALQLLRSFCSSGPPGPGQAPGAGHFRPPADLRPERGGSQQALEFRGRGAYAVAGLGSLPVCGVAPMPRRSAPALPCWRGAWPKPHTASFSGSAAVRLAPVRSLPLQPPLPPLCSRSRGPTST